MRLLFAAMTLACLAFTPSHAQNCESLSIRNAAGDVTATKRVCVDANGAWVDPATVSSSSEAAFQTFVPPEPIGVITEAPLLPAGNEIVPQAEVWQQPVLQVDQLERVVPLETSPPLPVAPLLPAEPSLGTIEVRSTPPASVRNPSAWQPTSGARKRQQLYAKLGLVCVARDAKFCTNGDCSGLCSGKHGWCDGKTGELHASLEAIERIYCKKKKRR